ncbi:MAG: hypothetical protein FWE49_04055 [Synergistaceae bacterium]|nr:hypothetical protein [Synergistaceae bacterium]
MKLIEVLIVLIVFSIFSLAVISQLDAEARTYSRLLETMSELDAKIELLRN